MIKKFTDIDGWFFWIDALLFASLLDAQRNPAPAVVVELGTYLGKSAVLIGDHLGPADRFVALDLFGRTDLLDSDTCEVRNSAEVQRSYPTLTRAKFEANYLALHSELPTIVEGLSSSIVDHVEPGTVRFLHVDASHLYDPVSVDVHNARSLLRPGGVAVFDDWRSEHTPGVGAAVWEAVFTAGLIPIALTPYKFYGVYSHPEPVREAVAKVARQDEVWSQTEEIAGHPVTRLKLRDGRRAPKATLNDADLDALAGRLATRLAAASDPAVPDMPAAAPKRRAAALFRRSGA